MRSQVVSDLFIIGGGINGTGIAADAAGRGLSVTLCEKGDLGSATSSASSKLIHGGLRYLENYEFSLVRKSLLEREILFRNNQNIVSALEFILPHEKHLRPAWMIRLGLFFYDHLASHPLLPDSKKIDLANDERGEALQSVYKTGFSYYDCFTDDARLVVLNALAAKDNGAEILTRTTFESAVFENNLWQIKLKNNASNESLTCSAKILVNVAGPWVAEVQKQINVTTPPLTVELVKGSHIVVPKIYHGNFAYILQNPDKRVVFAIPYQNDYTLVGTTDVPYTDSLNKVSISADEETYLCATINRFFKDSISPKNILWSYAGVRCLRSDKAKRPSDLTRGYEMNLLKDIPLLTVIGGKLTSYRILSANAVDKLHDLIPHLKPSNTANVSLPGNDKKDFADFLKHFASLYPFLPEKMALRLAKSYGTRAKLFLQNSTSLTELGVDFGAGLYENEVDYLCEQEWARTSEDILWRRTKLGLNFTPEQIKNLEQWLLARKAL